MANKDVNLRIGAENDTNAAFRQTNKNLDNISKQLKRAGNEARLFTAAFVTFKGAIQPAFRALRTEIVNIANTGATFEKMRIQLNAVMGDIEKGGRAVEWVERFTQETPFELETVAQNFIRLKAFGLDPLNGTFQAIADSAAKYIGTSEGLEAVSLQIGQAWAKQKLQGEEIRILLERGIPVWDLLQEATGKNVTELKKLSEQGKLGRKEIALLLQEMGKDAGGAAAEQMNTFNGQVSNLRDNITNFRKQIAQSGFLDFLTEKLIAVNEKFAEMRESGELAEIAKRISDALIDTAKAIEATIRFLVEYRSEIALTIKLFTALIALRMANNLRKTAAAVLILSRNFGIANASAKRLAGGIKLLRAGLLLAVAAFAGFKIGEYLREQFPVVRQFGVVLVGIFEESKIRIIGKFKEMSLRFKFLWDEPLNYVKQKFSEWLSTISEVVALLPDKFGGTFADSIKNAADQVKPNSEAAEQFRKNIAALRGETELEVSKMRDNITDMFKLAGEEPGKKRQKVKTKVEIETETEQDFGLGDLTGAAAQLEEKLARFAELSKSLLKDRKSQIARDLEEAIALAQELGKTEELAALKKKQSQLELKDLEAEINDAMSLRKDLIETVNLQREAGLISTAEAQERIKTIDEEHLPILEEMVAKARAMAEALGDNALVAKLDRMKAGLKGVKDEAVISAEQINEKFASGATRAIDDFISGTSSAKEAFRQFAADFLKQIAQMIIQQTILNALNNSGGGIGGAIAGLFHSGGIAGSPTQTRLVNPAMFAGAPRYQNGGIAGLQPDEVPAVLKRGEEVLTKADERHRANGGAQQQNVDLKVVNTIDSGSFMSEGLASDQGSKAFMNYVRANKSSISRLLSS